MTNACREIDGGDCANRKVCIALLDLCLLSHSTSHAAKSILTLRQSLEHKLTRVGAAHEHRRRIRFYYRESAAALCLVHDGRYVALSAASPPKREDPAPTDSSSPIPRRNRVSRARAVYVAGMRPETSSDTRSGLASRTRSCSPAKAPPLPFAHFYGISISPSPPWSSWARSSTTPT